MENKGKPPRGEGCFTCAVENHLQDSLETSEGGRGGERTWPGEGPTPESSLQKTAHGRKQRDGQAAGLQVGSGLPHTLHSTGSSVYLAWHCGQKYPPRDRSGQVLLSRCLETQRQSHTGGCRLGGEPPLYSRHAKRRLGVLVCD